MSAAKNQKSLVDKVYDFLCSVKLSLIVLIGLAVTSIIGTVLQQGKEAQHYYSIYGDTWGSVIEVLNLGDMYHSWWFLVLLSLLMVNIAFCSFKRFPSAWRQMKDADPIYTGRSVALHERMSLSVKGASVEDVAAKAEEFLSQKFGTPVGKADVEGSTYIMFSKGAWARYGVYVTHCSLFLFALGAIVGLLWGFKGYMPIIEGRTEQFMYARDEMPIQMQEDLGAPTADMETLRTAAKSLATAVAEEAADQGLHLDSMDLRVVDQNGMETVKRFELPEPSNTAAQTIPTVIRQLNAMGIGAGKSVSKLVLTADKFRRKIDFQILCENFDLEYYPDSQRPKDYKSDLVVFENGKEVERMTIEVNSPLIRDGIFFYQSSYGKVGVRSVKVTVAGPDRQYLQQNATLFNNGSLKLANGDELYIREMWKDQQGRLPDGIIFGIKTNGAPTSISARAFEPYVGRDWWPLGKYQVRLDSVDWWHYTGLQVAKDPGVPIVWAGCFLITIGLFVSFFTSHRRVWAKITPTEKTVKLDIVGNASRNRFSFERCFEDLCEDAQETFKN